MLLDGARDSETSQAGAVDLGRKQQSIRKNHGNGETGDTDCERLGRENEQTQYSTICGVTKRV